MTVLSTAFLEELHSKYLPLRQGKIADYIPELSKARPDEFGIAVTTCSGETFSVGDFQKEFTIQSISKPFVYGLALEDLGRDFLRSKVGVEPTGDAFNSIVELEENSHRPYNPMINSGAIAVTSFIQGASSAEKLNRILGLFSRYLGRTPHLDVPVFISERNTGHRNRAIAHLLRHFQVLSHDAVLDDVLDLYFQQCSIAMNARDLSSMAATLANGGAHPTTGERAIRSEFVRDLLSLMFTCGMYDSSGEWAYSVGFPAKSGVSGGILAVVPGQMGIAVYSPLLDSRGHSVRGIKVCEELSARLNLSIFDSTH